MFVIVFVTFFVTVFITVFVTVFVTVFITVFVIFYLEPQATTNFMVLMVFRLQLVSTVVKRMGDQLILFKI